MAKIPEQLRLDTAEIDALMRRESRIRVATIGPGHKINLTPMTFGWANGKVYIFDRGQKLANQRGHSTATVLLDVGDAWRDLEGIVMHGTARVLESAEEEAADGDPAAAKLNLGAKNALRKTGAVFPYEASATGRSRRWIVFEPGDVVSWNNERLPMGVDRGT